MKTQNLISFFFSALLSISFYLSGAVLAQDEFEEVEVLDHPRYSLTNRFALDADLTFLPLDAYYKPLIADLSGSYHFSEWFSWEIFRIGLPVYIHNTGLNSQIENTVNNQRISLDPSAEPLTLTTSREFKRFRFRASSSVFANLLYSKSNFFNRAVVYHYWQVGLGGGYYDLDSEDQSTIDVTLRARFFLNDNFMLNLRLAHSLGLDGSGPKNITQMGAGVGFAF